uniref:Uncharacterized protein n=1 Tax=Physcomitrium patens TaxID=3218 RepID=A0A2K1L8S3_PHYPA|nr:hypothetical protein PHYPA_000859 [Physcomitrium patens]
MPLLRCVEQLHSDRTLRGVKSDFVVKFLRMWLHRACKELFVLRQCGIAQARCVTALSLTARTRHGSEPLLSSSFRGREASDSRRPHWCA